MSSQAARPGKTGPRLLQDAFILDERHAIPNLHVLRDPPPVFDDQSAYPVLHAQEACPHEYSAVRTHSRLPENRNYPHFRKTDVYQAAAICKRCRLHLHAEISFMTVGRRPCPNEDYPLHHFILDSSQSTDAYRFVCSSPDCKAILQLRYDGPVIGDEDIELLTNPDLLERRYEAALNRHKDRAGFRRASPVDALWRLRRYITDSLAADAAGKKIPAINKRFLEAFGQDCDGLLHRLGFRFAGQDEDPAWLLPQVPPHSEEPEAERLSLEWWDVELQALIDRYCAQNGDLNPCSTYSWPDAKPDFDTLLSTSKYEKSLSGRQTRQDNIGSDHPHYASLGGLRDFSDQLISFCFDRQSDCDPQNTPYYFDCLKGIATGRDSETLLIKATTLESQGVVGRKEVQNAYKSLDVLPHYTDEFIIGRYRVRLQDTGVSMHAHLKSTLEILGRSRGSSALLDAASDQLETYEQALSWLGAERTYADDAIITLYTTKTADSPSTSDMARRAVKVIADTRQSEALRSWLSTGELKDSGMSVDDACAHLQIKLGDVDESMLNVVFENARKDNPGTKTDQAIATVLEARSNQAIATRDPETWPVGLTSHGNTCYLNSLLQYYFTVKALRDIVLRFDDYRFDLATTPAKTERVGGLKVRPFEIRAYQKFVDDLRHLFESMIKDAGTAVKPEADLVCRAFLKAEDTDAHAISSAASNTSKDDLSKSDVEMSGDVSQVKLQEPTPTTTKDASRVLSRPSPPPYVGSVSEDTPDAMTQSTFLPPSPPPSRPTSPQKAGAGLLHAPPLPPRQMTSPELQQSNLSKAEEAARQQQDVTEVMDEILFRLRAAVNPRGADAREEQLDAFRDIFYMRISEKTFADSQNPTSTDEDAINILLNIPTAPTDIYTALDEVFDLQTIDHGGKKLSQYKSLQTLPPVLQINIPRNTYDRATGRGVKVEHKMHLEDTLYMDRYTDLAGGDIMARRRRCWAWRKDLRSLQAEKDVLQKTASDMDGASTLDAASDYIKYLREVNSELFAIDVLEMQVDQSLTSELSSEVNRHKQRSSAIDSKIAELTSRISAEFDGLEKMKYRLQAVFFHRGGYGHGHYWTYIHDFRNDIWRIYNDEKVEEFTKLEDIFDAQTWQQGTPTYAVYVKDDVKDEYVEAVCRHIERPPPPLPPTEPVDEVMQDVGSESVGDAGKQTVAPAPEYPPPPQPGAPNGEKAWSAPKDVGGHTQW